MRERVVVLKPRKGMVIEMFQTGFDERGAAAVEVVVRDNGKEIFGPNTPGMRLVGALGTADTVDGIDAKRFALGYASTHKGDTDDEFFVDYTPEQIAWTDANGEELRLINFSRYGDG
jgi:hypothetical protein